MADNAIFRTVVFLMAAVAAWMSTRLLIPVLRRAFMDVPNGRSSHVRPTPRGGGLGILAGLGCACAMVWMVTAMAPMKAFVLGMVVVAGISLIDDAFTVSAPIRLC